MHGRIIEIEFIKGFIGFILLQVNKDGRSVIIRSDDDNSGLQLSLKRNNEKNAG